MYLLDVYVFKSGLYYSCSQLANINHKSGEMLVMLIKRFIILSVGCIAGAKNGDYYVRPCEI